jgi:aquaporin Z
VHDRLHWSSWAGEFVGTAWHVFVGTFAVVLGFDPASPLVHAIPNPAVRRLIVGVIFVGSAVTVPLTPLGRRSGGHVNPAVTFAFYLRRKLGRRDLVGYIAAQCAGAVLGAAAASAVGGGAVASVNHAVTQPQHGLSPWAALGIEAGETALIVSVIFALVSHRQTMRYAPLGVWLVLSVVICGLAPLTGASINPARSLGPAVSARQLSSYWVYVAGPMLGAAVAAVAWATLARRRPLTAKLFHDPRWCDEATDRCSALERSPDAQPDDALSLVPIDRG